MTDDIVIPDQREATRLLVLQRALIDRLKKADDETRAEALPAWRTGEKAVGQVDGVTIGNVAREKGAVTASVTNWPDLMAWAEEHAGEDAWELERPFPTEQMIKQGAAAIERSLPHVITAPELLAEEVLRAALEKRKLRSRKVTAWVAAMKIGDDVVSPVTGEVFTEIPGITVNTAPDKLVVRPDWKTVGPVVDRILSGPELKEVTGG